MATVRQLVVDGPEGTVSLLHDDVALTYTGIELVLTTPVRVCGKAGQFSFNQVLPAGTRTISFPSTVQLLPELNFKGQLRLRPQVELAYGAGG